MATELPKIKIGKKTYYIDQRLGEIRNVDDFSDAESVSYELIEYWLDKRKKHKRMDRIKQHDQKVWNRTKEYNKLNQKRKAQKKISTFTEKALDEKYIQNLEEGNVDWR